MDTNERHEINDLSVIELQQGELCNKYGCNYVPAPFDLKVGLARATLGQIPINGMRIPPDGDTTGWYIWCGEELSSDPDFFSPLHVRHLPKWCPEVLNFLGLPPGYKFLLAGEYVDVWYDSSLLDVD